MNPLTRTTLARGYDLIADIESELLSGIYDPEDARARINTYIKSTLDCGSGAYWAARPVITFTSLLPASSGAEALMEYQALTAPLTPRREPAS